MALTLDLRHAIFEGEGLKAKGLFGAAIAVNGQSTLVAALADVLKDREHLGNSSCVACQLSDL